MKKKISETEIDFAEICYNLWKYKISILSITLTVVFISLGIKLNKKPNFLAITEIRAINIYDEIKYDKFNAILKSLIANQNVSNNLKNLNFVAINKSLLLNLYLEKIRENQIFIDLIKENNLIKRNDYSSKIEYEDAIERMALSVTIIPPNKENSSENFSSNFWRIKFETSDKEIWEKILLNINKNINQHVKDSLYKKFDTSLKISRLQLKFKIEDINDLISRAKIDYEKLTKKRLAFLKEQSLIARQLDIKKNTLIAENFKTDSNIISNLKTDNSYYTKGYVMIEKEIELIESRINTNYFTNDLFKLEKMKQNLIDDRNLKRGELEFLDSPIAKNEDFKAADLNYRNTKYKDNNFSTGKVLFFSLLLGVIISILYVLIIRTMTQYKLKR